MLSSVSSTAAMGVVRGLSAFKLSTKTGLAANEPIAHS
jgi:hypothetical protein